MEEVKAEKVKKKDKPLNKKDIDENKIVTFLSYIGFLCIVPLVAKKESEFAQFHAKQGLVLLLAWIVGSITIPIFGIGFIINIGVVILSIMGLINVNDGNMKELPIVGDLAKKINI